MRKLFWLLILLVLVFMARPIWEDKASEYVDLGFLAPIDRAVDQVTEGPAIENALTQAKQFTLQVGGQLKSFVASSSAEMPVAVSKPALDETQSLFAVHNVTLGMTKEEAQAKVGLPLRLMRNEYGTDWHSYHQDYQNYVLLSYDQEGKVNGMFTNQALISSTKEITMQSKRAEVRSALGIPLKSLQKGNVQYILDTREEYDVFKIDSIYITVFYDLHEENTVTAIQVIDGGLEENRPEIYAEPNDEVREGYEYLLFELTNSARIQRELPLLKWDEATKETARKHSEDMADNKYFSHTNLEGKSPFDRMGDDGITFFVAGENLAYGQYSSIFAHEGLMNSLGHRENIVKRDFGYLGVGAAFNSDNQPYFTANFFNR
ncbi:CAP-associated domain-containing protein [Planococcus sp. APC 3906]|uniref:CAP domain-containing protein n=1 Tax=Planococcus sp. APC 3906 TaxID=3035194 RepID=UPI0025B39ABF|nr:CAP-associated domain-containing protein [Planococcus sp. APC 3906]MDN3449007.1 CAP-associated domain-containing protein [Planococcus sp. APC 3906]